MSFEIIILGSSSAVPLPDRNPSAQILKYNGSKILLDCGEGTQIQLIKNKIKSGKISHIFISHLHVDHYAGLIGLISSFALQNRTTPLDIYSPEGLEKMIRIQLEYTTVKLPFKLNFHNVISGSSNPISCFSNINVYTLTLNHRVPCFGYIFKEIKTERKIKKESLESLKLLPFEAFNVLKAGKDYTDSNGNIYYSKDHTQETKQKSYAYITDTLYNENIIPDIQHTDLLFHEATFLNELLDKAKQTYHSTALQAAQIAKNASAKKLIIGHFSARYRNLDGFLKEAKSVFKNTELATEGKVFKI